MLEKLTEDVAKKETGPGVAPQMKSRFKPKAPALRYKDRHPEVAEAMEIDDDDYVYDTYYREEVMDGTSESVAEPTGSVGVIVIGEEDEDLWEGFGEEEEDSDRVYTDDEDENAEDYYANDYPEDELESEDEFDKNPYRYHHGSDEEEYDADNDPWSDEEEDKNARPRDDFGAALDDMSQFAKLHPAPQDRDHDMEVV
ncbi:hypothetical protein BCR34DRAFT_609252 [Clohesyomyces aquaticus]|uniref:Transcription factor Iwr1 domain-containing protein n=1 Tax=Clohesyomyces aquaticus TaxID=1231657 RepID=A0A1Y1XV16_9PLEO|nr:hypothetical protein BCR34DRAFT_609252 [Clohesyomyces aquaticus]